MFKSLMALRSQDSQKGFTLLEVMIALSIFAICALTLLQQSGRSVRQASQLETRTQASWIAQNELERLRLTETFSAIGKAQRVLTFGNRQWTITQEISATTHNDLRKASITVTHGTDNPNSKPATRFQLTGFLGRY